MPSTTLPELVTLLRGPSLTVRTGLWLAPLTILGRERDEAARLGIDAIDVREPILAAQPQGTRFLGLNEASMVDTLDTICRLPRLSDCVLVYNLDLPLARLSARERNQFWQILFTGFPHRSRGLLLLLPQQAHHLLPPQQAEEAWRNDNRLVD